MTFKEPIEGKSFEVNPHDIPHKLFYEAREDRRQEYTRQLILKAFEEVKKNHKRYGRFKTMIPKKTWPSKTGEELKILAEQMGGHMANWVEQSLEWAQRIANGESWESICNAKDRISCSRLIIWKNGYARLISVSCNGAYAAASCVGSIDYYLDDVFRHAVPLVVLKE